MTVATPAQIAKGALRRLATSQQEPTPENYARAYAEESGHANPPVLPERARPLLEKLAGRLGDEAARRDELVAALMQGRWDIAAQALERSAHGASAQAQALTGLIERVVRGMERGSKQWSLARRKESLQRVLDGSRSDLHRLQQRLGSLVGAWDTDASLPPAEGEAPSAEAAVEPAHEPVQAGADWSPVVDELRGTVRAGLPEADARAVELAERLAHDADRLAAEGPGVEALQSLQATCADIQRLFGHRQQLMEQLGRLCHELGQGLAELAEDESWARGQAQALQARLGDGLSTRSVRAASEILSETRQRHLKVRSERDEARNALKHLLHRLLDEIGELGAHTGRFHEAVGRHVEAIEAADSIESLAGVVRELVDDSRAVRDLVHQAQQRLQAEHARASALEDQVRSLEGELRRLSDEVGTDALTQVANRRGLAQAFAAESARALRDGARLALGLIDIDNFKKLNDTLGHAAGDKALQSLAAAVRERLRPVDHLARVGGEEFVVMLPGTSLDEAQQALTRLQRALSAALFMHDEQEVFITFSAGVTLWRDGEALEAGLERADEALYEAKRTGKNRTCTA